MDENKSWKTTIFNFNLMNKKVRKSKNVKIIVKIFCECGGIFAPDPNPFLLLSIKMLIRIVQWVSLWTLEKRR